MDGNYESFDKLDFDDLDFNQEYDYQVRHNDVDFLGHMNNTKYPDMLCDYIPEIEARYVDEFSISWGQEAKFGSEIDIHLICDKNESDTFFFRITEKGDARAILAEARIHAPYIKQSQIF